MIAPPLQDMQLTMQRVRCTCHEESLVAYPRAWYRFQGEQTIEAPCWKCNKSLLPMQIPVGAVHRVFGVQQMPLGVAAAISVALASEITEAQDTPAVEVPLDSATWSIEHQASPQHADWIAAQPAPAPIDRTRLIENAVATGVLVAVVVISTFF